MIGKAKKTLEKIFSKTKILYIPNGLEVANSFKKKNKNKLILFVGDVVKEKGIEELLNTWQTINQNKYSLKIVGEVKHNYLNFLKNKFNLKNVYFTGRLPNKDVLNLLKISSIFVLPSYSEGFPYSVLEAMSYRNAVIATNVGALPEILSNDAGFVIERKNITELRKKLTYLISNKLELEKFQRNAYQKVKNNYGLKSTLKKYILIWEDKF